MDERHDFPSVPMTKDGGPLEGLLVVGLEHSVAGPLCTRILSDLGARAIKVERAPHGDFARHWDGNVYGEGAQFWWLNRGKESVVLDLKSPEGRVAFDALLERADSFVCNVSPGAADRLGLGESQLRERFPRLVSCQISGYGTTGEFRDRKAYDMLVQAEAGVMSLTGTPDRPSRAGVSISDVGTGIYAAALILAALIGRGRDGAGRHLDVAMYDATIEFAAPMLISYLNAGVLYPRMPDRHHAIAPYGVFVCADGSRLLLAIEHDAEWQRFAGAILGRPDLGEDPRFATNVDRVANRELVDELVAEAIGALDRAEAERAVADLGLAYASLNDMQSVSAHPVVTERAMLRQVEANGGDAARTLVGLGERLFGVERPDLARPPALGEHTEAVLAELGISQPAAQAGARGTRSDGTEP
jgi:crotonobetainyl-CoA:carnitine CoA-transferase CaiB-like acyl-CoA transferase